MKILFRVPKLGIEILENQRWNLNEITLMNDDHIYNSLLWCQMRKTAAKQAQVEEIKVFGFTYSEWVEIFKCEMKRRKEVAIEKERKVIVDLYLELNPDIKRNIKLQELRELAEKLDMSLPE